MKELTNYDLKFADVVLDVCTNLPAWPGRHLLDDGEKRRYFGLKTQSWGIVEFDSRIEP